MVKLLMLAMGAIMVYLGATGKYKDVGQVLGMSVGNNGVKP